MTKAKKRSTRYRRALQHRLSILSISGVIVVLAVSLFVASIPLRKKNQDFKTKEAELKEQLEEAAADGEEIDELEEYVGTEEYVEDVAKDKLGLVYPNEILFQAEP